MKKLVLVSGGLDSGVCLAKTVAENGSENVIALNAYYGQKHQKEMKCARALCDLYGVRLLELNLADVMQYSECSLLSASGREIIHESYEEQTKKTNGDPVETYVPFRNGVLLSVASAIAYSLGADEVVIGVHADDSAGAAYPDCSADFIAYMDNAVFEGTAGKVGIDAPFAVKTKADIVREGLRLHMPFELTWSCYEGGEKPCGKCGTCIDRAEAFKANGVKDPAL